MRTGIIWISILLLFLSANFFVFWHVWKILPLPAWAKAIIVTLMALSFCLLFANFAPQMDTLPMSISRGIYEIGTSWTIVMLYLLMIFLVLDAGRLLHMVPASFLKDSLWGSISITAFMLVILVYGNIHYNHKVRQPLELTTGKEISKPLKIVMMSDLHLGYHNSRKEFARWVDLVNAEQPDLILIAGDIIDRSIRPLEEEKTAEEFHRLKAPAIACLGNHEHYAGEPNAKRFYREAGITLLCDSVMQIDDIYIIGRNDRTDFKRKKLGELMKGIDRSKYMVLLDHQPFNLEAAEQQHVDFQLSGHTHYGQVWPISWITNFIYEKAFGAYQKGNTRYYISSGIGIWGGKFRIGTRSEYVVATVKHQ